MEIENLQEKVQKAKEAVESLEEPLKTEAFKKILDKLLEIPLPPFPDYVAKKDSLILQGKIRKRKKLKGNNFGQSGLKAKEESEKKKRELASKLNRSQYPDLYKLKGILPEALYVLKIMKEKGVEGLTPPEIQFILKEIFRIKRSAEAVSVALNRKGAMKYTDRNRKIIGGVILAYTYELMVDGEDYLKEKLKKLKNDHEDKIDDGKEPDLP